MLLASRINRRVAAALGPSLVPFYYTMTGASAVAYLYGFFGLATLLPPILFTYLLVAFRLVSGKPGAILCCCLLFGYYLTMNYLDSIEAVSEVNHICILMIMTAKLTTVFIDVLRNHPTPSTLRDTLGFCFFLPTLMMGPIFNYQTYLNLGTHPAPDDPEYKRQESRAARKKFFHAVVYLGIYSVASAFLPIETLKERHFYQSHSMPYIFGYIYLFVAVQRFKYYFSWNIADTLVIYSGLGVSGKCEKTNRILFEGNRSVDVWLFETGTNLRQLIKHWNMSTERWLLQYVYWTVAPRGKKSGVLEQLITCMVNAAWHGSSFGYYTSFLLFFAFSATAKIIQPLLDGWYFKIPKPIRNALQYLIIHVSLSAIFLMFFLLRRVACLEYLGNVKYLPAICPIFSFAATLLARRIFAKK